MKFSINNMSIYLYRGVVDFRKAVNGLSAIVEEEFSASLYDEALFVFCNRRRDKLKCLYWDRTGFALWYKRLEQSRYQWPRLGKGDVLSLGEQEFMWLLEGYDITKMRPHKTLNYQEVM